MQSHGSNQKSSFLKSYYNAKKPEWMPWGTAFTTGFSCTCVKWSRHVHDFNIQDEFNKSFELLLTAHIVNKKLQFVPCHTEFLESSAMQFHIVKATKDIDYHTFSRRIWAFIMKNVGNTAIMWG